MTTTDYLVELKATPPGATATVADGIAFIEHSVLPTLAVCQRLQTAGTVVAGGPVPGAVALSFIVRVASAQELDELVASLPLWPRAQTTVTPLTTFAGREAAVRQKLTALKQLQPRHPAERGASFRGGRTSR